MNIINYLKSNPIILILAIILVTLLSISLYRELSKPPSTPPLAEVEIVNSFESKLSSIAIGSGTINISAGLNYINNYKESAPILTYTPAVLDDNFVNTTNEKLGVNQINKETAEGLGEVVMSGKDTKSLDIYKKWGSIIYTDQQVFAPNVNYSFGGDAKVDEYEKKALDFAKSIGINMDNYKLDTTQYLNYPSDEPQPLTNIAAAGLIEFTYTAKTDDLPIIDSVSNLSPGTVDVFIDKSFVVRKVRASIIGTPGKATANLKTKTIDELKESIKKGEGVLIDSSFAPGTKVLYTNVESANLMYYASDNRLIPVYVIDATLTSETGASGTGKLIVKAF